MPTGVGRNAGRIGEAEAGGSLDRATGSGYTPQILDHRTMPKRTGGLALWAALATVYVVWGSTYLGIAVAIEVPASDAFGRLVLDTLPGIGLGVAGGLVRVLGGVLGGSRGGAGMMRGSGADGETEDRRADEGEAWICFHKFTFLRWVHVSGYANNAGRQKLRRFQ